jgi:putative FmdB family regulatory protein
MPIYEYRCEHCGHEMDALQKISDAPLVNCPACGRPDLKKLISAAGFRLKGAGWYETDFKKGNKKNLHDDGRKATDAKPGGEKPDGKSKPETKKPAPEKKAAG